jgi:3-oxoacyl-[acyl-carrier protein] reductase/meso-butanediol dehydrogenase/(S,S)-butanediol dehydrogenase/diacetyl reductase
MSRTVIITGGTRGIGEAITRYFHHRGDRVVISARSDNGLASELGEGARFHRGDAADPASHEATVSAAMEWTGRVDVYVNNAGLSGWRPVEAVTEEFWQTMIDVNLKSVLFGCQSAAKVMRAGGVILNMSSMAAKRGTANNSVYCAAKFGVNGITQALAKELGPRGIRVNALCPVLVRTQGLEAALSEPFAPGAKMGAEAFISSFAAANSALGPLPTAEQVASFCYLLASDEASAITGQCINIDCGVFPQ